MCDIKELTILKCQNKCPYAESDIRMFYFWLLSGYNKTTIIKDIISGYNNTLASQCEAYAMREPLECDYVKAKST